MTRDIRNVQRGKCEACGNCDNFISVSGRVLCDYCGCPPAQHQPMTSGAKAKKRSGRNKLFKNELLEESDVEEEPQLAAEEVNAKKSTPGAKSRIIYNTRFQDTYEGGAASLSSGGACGSSGSSSQQRRAYNRFRPAETFTSRDHQQRSGGKSRRDKGESMEATTSQRGSSSRRQRRVVFELTGGSPKKKSMMSQHKKPELSIEIPSKLDMLLDMPAVDKEEQLDHAWNQDDKSYNIFIKDGDPFTFHRHPVAQSTDGIRSKSTYEKGMHLFEVKWPVRQRGTHAVIGFSTSDAPIHSLGYQSLVGNNEHSWGWDLGRSKVFHNSQNTSYPENLKPNETFAVPEKFLVMLDMDQGFFGCIVDGKYLGPAIQGLKGKKLHLMISAVWGHCEITMKYLNGLECQPLPLMDMCRNVIRKSVDKSEAKISQLNLPKMILDYLQYKDKQQLTHLTEEKQTTDTTQIEW